MDIKSILGMKNKKNATPELFPLIAKGMTAYEEFLSNISTQDLQDSYGALWDRNSPYESSFNEKVKDTAYYQALLQLSLMSIELYAGRGAIEHDHGFQRIRKHIFAYLESISTQAYLPESNSITMELLKSLIYFKNKYENYQHEFHQLFVDIGARAKNLGRDAKTDSDKEWFSFFYSVCSRMRHSNTLRGIDVDNYTVAQSMGDLYYDQLSVMLGDLSRKLNEDGDADLGRGRQQLAGRLTEAAKHIESAAQSIDKAWALCSPHTDPYIKNYGLEDQFDPDASRKAKIDGFVRGCCYRFRDDGLEGIAHLKDNERFKNDPDFDEMVDRLIENLDLLWLDDTQVSLREEIYKIVGKSN